MTEDTREAEVFVVVGSSGDYEEFREWNVVAFRDAGAAAAYAAHAQTWLLDFWMALDALDLHWEDAERWRDKHPNPYDAGRDDRDTRYQVEAVSVLLEPVSVAFVAKRFRRKHKSSDEA